MKFFLVVLSFFLLHCSTTPSASVKKDLIIADTALKRAKKASADKSFPKSYNQMQSLYKKGRFLFENNQRDSAKKHFQKAIKLAEKIELHSLYKKKKQESDF